MEPNENSTSAIDLLTSLEARQDEVLEQLDALNAKIEATLQQLGKLKVETSNAA